MRIDCDILAKELGKLTTEEIEDIVDGFIQLDLENLPELQKLVTILELEEQGRPPLPDDEWTGDEEEEEDEDENDETGEFDGLGDAYDR